MSHYCIGDAYSCGQIIGELLGTDYQIYPQQEKNANNNNKLALSNLCTIILWNIVNTAIIILDSLKLLEITDYFALAKKTDLCVICTLVNCTC